MKKLILYLFIATAILSCDSEDAPGCFQTAGNLVQEELFLDSFERILINERVELIIKQGPEQKIVVESGANLMPDIDIHVSDNQLIATDNNNCNFFRDYGITKLYVTAPNITEIRNSSEQTVSSEGILNYRVLKLLTEDFQTGFINVGDFILTVDTEQLNLISNGISNFYVTGNTKSLNINFAAGDSRFEGENLRADNVTILHKSTNDILVFPIDKIEGDIYSLGDVIAFNTPEIIDVTEHYNGRLIFN